MARIHPLFSKFVTPFRATEPMPESNRSRYTERTSNVAVEEARARGHEKVEKDRLYDRGDTNAFIVMGDREPPSQAEKDEIDFRSIERHEDIDQAYDKERRKHVMFRDPGGWMHLAKTRHSKHTAITLRNDSRDDDLRKRGNVAKPSKN